MSVKQPRNDKFITKDGQVGQDWLRYFQSLQNTIASVFTGDSGSGGTAGIVPAPEAGDSTKYLKGDGTWADLPSSVSNLTLIESWTATAAASKTFSDIPQTYSQLLVAFSGLAPSAGGPGVGVVISDDNGSTFKTTNYFGTVSLDLGASSTTDATVSSDWRVSNILTAFSGFIEIKDYTTGSGFPKSAVWGGRDTGGYGGTGAGTYLSIGAINAIKITIAAGTFTATGTIKLYGRV